MSLEQFRKETRTWLEDNCPQSMRGQMVHFEEAHEVYSTDDAKLWLNRAAERGWTAPTWETRYGGGGLDKAHAQVLTEEMQAIKALPPATGMGFVMIGPTLLEFGTEEQKLRHLPRITSGEVHWCQGYSEPGAGSDLAGLRTRAEDQGDHFVLNGQKIWTTGANHADWMFALVRTDFDAPKHQGISFVLLDMHQEGVTVKPIPLISGSSPFCETFFDNAIALKEDLVGELNNGWTVGKRLLQYERSGATRSASSPRQKKKPVKRLNPLAKLAKEYQGENDGKIASPELRREVLDLDVNQTAMGLTARRVVEEQTQSGAPGAATSIFKYLGSTLGQDAAELAARMRGTQGLGWEGPGFSESELDACRAYLRDRAMTIYGGTNEVQLNIIAKRVLGLPDG